MLKGLTVSNHYVLIVLLFFNFTRMNHGVFSRLQENASLGQKIRLVEENSDKMTEDIKKLMKIRDKLARKVIT